MSELSLAKQNGPERRAFENLLERVLAPLMPIAINFGLSSNELFLAMRIVYLREIEKRLEQERGVKVSDARLALVTGMTRSEVVRARLRAGGKSAPTNEAAEQLSRVAVVLSIWHTSAKFAGAYGLPLDLDLERNEKGRSIEELLEVACAEMSRPITLDELIASGVAEIIGGVSVRCSARTAISSAAGGQVGLLEQYGRFLGAASGTVAHNIATGGDTTGYFDRLLVSDVALSESTRNRFYARAKSSTDTLLTELDGWLSKNADDSAQNEDRRYGVGLFFFEERREQETLSEAEDTLKQDAV